MTDTELRTKAQELAPAGCATSAAVLRLLDELARLRGREAELLAKLAYQSEVMKKLVESKYPAVAT